MEERESTKLINTYFIMLIKSFRDILPIITPRYIKFFVWIGSSFEDFFDEFESQETAFEKNSTRDDSHVLQFFLNVRFQIL